MTRQCSHWASGKRNNLDSALVSQQQASLRGRDIINSHSCRCTVSGGQSVLAECHMLCGGFWRAARSARILMASQSCADVRSLCIMTSDRP